MRVTVDMIAVLREKYREIKRLRTVDAAHVALGQAHDPKPQMAALARRFPGALRELDELSMTQIDARLAALDAALTTQSVPEWAALQVAYHGTYRFALRVKLRAARQGARDEAALEHAITRLLASPRDELLGCEPDEPPLGALDAEMLRAILRPAGGRLQPWVIGYVARALAVAPERVTAALFARDRAGTPEKP
jgi:hypothetical protein